MALFDDIAFLAGGGADQALLNLQAFGAEEAAFRDRSQSGQDLLTSLVDLQRDPFSLVPALQAQAASGGGPAGAFFAAGGKPQETGLGPLINQLIQGLSEFALGVDPKGAKVSPETTAAQAAAAQTTAGTTSTGGVTTPGATTAPSVGGSTATADRSRVAAVSPSPIGQVGPPVGPVDRNLLPQSIQDAIAAFEAGLGDVTTIGQAVADRSLSDINRSFIQRTDQALATNPSVLEDSIRSAIGKRQSRRGARNQLATSSVGRAVR